MKGSEAEGRGAFSTGDGPGSAEAWRWPGPRRPRQPCPGLGGRAGERKVAASVGRVAANEFHLEASGGSGADADFRGNTISAANFSAFPETRPFHFSRPSPLRPGSPPPASLLLRELGARRFAKLHRAAKKHRILSWSTRRCEALMLSFRPKEAS